MKVLCSIFLLAAASLASAQTVTCSKPLNPTAPTLTMITCSFPHTELQGGTVTRKFGVFLPASYSPLQSGMILKTGGTGHGIANDCKNAPAVSEDQGWIPFLATVPAPAPVMVCPEGWFGHVLLANGNQESAEVWNTWGSHTGNNCYGGVPCYTSTGVQVGGWNTNGGLAVLPNDIGFLSFVVSYVQAQLQLDPTFMATTADWGAPSVIAMNFAAVHPEQVSSVALYTPTIFNNVGTGFVDSDGTTIQPPVGGVPIMELVSPINNSNPAPGMCGQNPIHPLATDQVISFWAGPNSAVVPTTYDGGGSQFCLGVNQPSTAEHMYASSPTGNPIEIWKLVANTKGTPWCSYNYLGVSDPTICSSTDVPKEFDVPPALCTWQWPCNHFMLHEPSPATVLQLEYNWMVNNKR